MCCGSQLVVLKFGGSVLNSEDQLSAVVHEIYRHYSAGDQVVAVVSALGNTTNQLFAQSRKFGPRLSEATVAKLAATGEATSAALLGLALDRVGVPNEVHDEMSLGIRTAGPPLDSEIEQVDLDKFAAAFDRAPVLIVPGFVGRDELGRISLLGRGGSDLTALFLANELKADHCCLIKDVDGLFEWDPKRSGSPRQFRSISFEAALTLDESIVQHKAIRFAREYQLPFEVRSLRSTASTWVGSDNDDQFHEMGQRPLPLRVGLLGLGTVGLGVYRHLNDFPSVQVGKIAVRDVSKAVGNGAPDGLVTNNAVTVIQNEVDIVIELMGGIEPALTLVRAALESGKHVITANKALIARHGTELAKLADQNKVHLYFSAAVGGGVPMIEKVRQWNVQHDPLVQVEGILNGTCNYVLDRVAQGVSFPEAVLAAQREGFAEADPSRDLDGTDAAEKLVILARNSGFHLDVSQVARESLDESLVLSWPSLESPPNAPPEEVYRQVTSLRLLDPIAGESEQATTTSAAARLEAKVEIRRLPRNHVFASAQAEDNRLLLVSRSGNRTVVNGRGAGKYPTSQSVVNDLVRLIRQLNDSGVSDISGNTDVESGESTKVLA